MKKYITIVVLLFNMVLLGCSATVSEQKQRVEQLKQATRWYQAGDLTAAEQHLVWLHDNGLATAQSWGMLGNIYFRQYRFKASERAYVRSLELDSGNQDIWFNLALNQLRQTTNTVMDARVELDDLDDGLKELLTQLLALQQQDPKDAM